MRKYVRTDADGNIIKSFSEDFVQPEAGDILVEDTPGRHYNLNLYTSDGLPRLKWDGEKVVERATDEIYTLDKCKEQALERAKAKARARVIDKLVQEDPDYLAEVAAIEAARDKGELDDRTRTLEAVV
jgi:hypothetical protein